MATIVTSVVGRDAGELRESLVFSVVGLSVQIEHLTKVDCVKILRGLVEDLSVKFNLY